MTKQDLLDDIMRAISRRPAEDAAELLESLVEDLQANIDALREPGWWPSGSGSKDDLL